MRKAKTIWLACVLAIAALGSQARPAAGENAETITLRIATAAPKGTQWAKDVEVFVKEVDKSTGGAVKVKVYYGGSAGDEKEVSALLAKGKLDGTISGGPMCAWVMPSMRVMGIVGLFQSQDEAIYVVNELRPTLEKEAHDAGYALLTMGSIGPIIAFTKAPIASMKEFLETPLWSWDLNDVFLLNAAEMKSTIVPTSLADASRTFDEGKLGGFLTTPVAALAFQWYVGTKYITDLRTGYLMACLLVREPALDRISTDHQQVLREAAIKLGLRVEYNNKRTDEKLLGGVYQKQGLKMVPVSKKFRAEFFEAARAARERLADKLVPKALLERVQQLLADYRAENPT